MSSEITEEKMIVLRSSDGDTFEVEEAVALESKTIKHVIEDHCFDRGIPLPNVTSKILSKVIEYCNRHAAADNASDGSNLSKMVAIEDLKKFDTDFVKDLDRETLLDLILAADYLSIKDLLDLTCQAMADMIQLMSPEQVREVLSIENDFTKEEEDKIRKENAWAFE